jgi:hypothetical protein
LAPLDAGEERGEYDSDKELDRRMGDEKRSQAKLSDLLKTAQERVEAAQIALAQCTCKTGRTINGLITKLTDIKKEEALLLDLLRLMRKHYDCIRKV